MPDRPERTESASDAERSWPMAPWRHRLHEIIFEADTPSGLAFDIALIVCILASVVVVLLDSVGSFHDRHGTFLSAAEWFFTILFTVEYVLRLISVQRPRIYIFSFYGIIDLLSVLPTYVSLVVPGAHELMVIRSLRLLRLFRILKLTRFLREARQLRSVIMASRAKIAVFLSTVMITVVIVGAAMHLIEGAESGFTSIPVGVYWAIVTMTTVGYGDITPQTPVGKTLAAIMMVLGYGLIIIPTGIISAELTRAKLQSSTQHCHRCGLEMHDDDAVHCKRCGEHL